MILTKRNSLELFIKEQIQGPGACNNQFYCENDPTTESGQEEILNTTPGSVYSTAVLFPLRKEADTNLVSPVGEEVKAIDVDQDRDSAYNESQDDSVCEVLEERANRLGSDEEDLYSLSQRFPTTIGLSCCLQKDNSPLSSDDLIVSVSGRYYTKIKKADYTSIVVRVADTEGFVSFFNQYASILSPYFSLSADGVKLTTDISSDIGRVKDLLLSINKELCKSVATDENGSIDQEYLQIGENYRYLKSYKERLWRKLRYFKDNYLSSEQKLAVESNLHEIEKYETNLSYLEDILGMCNAKSFGFWRSHTFDKSVDLSSIDFNKDGKKIIYSPKKNKELNIVFEGEEGGEDFLLRLSIWLQITTFANDSSNKKYIKFQVENSSTPFEEDNNHYFSIVTEKVNERCFFGINLKVESPYLAPYQEKRGKILQEDVEQLNYLYRSIKDYAVGHSCSVDWKISDKTKWVATDFLPSFETPDVEAVPRDKYSYTEIDGAMVPIPLLDNPKTLEFKWLSAFSQATDAEIITGLKAFVNSYGDWITKQRTVLSSNPENNRIGYDNLKRCEDDYKRMISNIEFLLEGNDSNMMSFRVMNSAMFIQLWHSKRSTNQETTYDFYKNEADDHLFGDFPAAWRPFQLAFILLNLDGIIKRADDEKWERRNELVDLVWFPTGGGKTEAYLGIIALTIIIRRRTISTRNGGTTAIMRYTLRLLATQQFQRAMRVIFALEQLRLWKIYDLGNEQITIGLFVGDDSLPNTSVKLLDECIKWSSIDDNGTRKESKIPLDICPCCGQRLEYQNRGTASAPKITFRCKNVRCTFGMSLPVVLCDESIYQSPPTLLFGTVDKFASLGHKVSSTKENQDSRRLFGNGGIDNLPPALIIQDELHLLLGPLGSAVSLFECAIDQLCSYKDANGSLVRPKIISSTATTRNTELQIRALYDREVSIFPKSGIDYDDSFFSFYKREQKDGEVYFVSKRKYLGIFPTGRTHMTTQMRLVATIFVHRAIFEKAYATRMAEKDVEQAMDYYHSVVDYFNSLKEVGKTDAQFFTEFTKYTRRLFKRVLRFSDNLECLYGYDSSFKKSELTGRLTGGEVVRELDTVSKHWKASDRFPHYDDKSNEWVQGTTPPDLILATNMISVGLDVDRFNTIIMNSMPRNIAEYIQASSRVARSKSGLVITLHNPFRARDLSHFERFKEFHEKLYYYVEPISITPFSKKSVNKYMPLYIATMIRHNYLDLANSDSAAGLTTSLQEKIKEDITAYFKDRLHRTESLSENLRELLTDELEQYIESFLNEALQYWQFLVDGQSVSNYSLRYSGSEYINNKGRSAKRYKDLFLALDAYNDDETSNYWSVPMSLRTVESEAVLNIKDN
ncbi:MAG: helicase [Bacteroidales bacterium]|nr:hypothetical protein [Tyzzerella sp.]MBQ6870864.1 helicase [Bacteroidales bacterium]